MGDMLIDFSNKDSVSVNQKVDISVSLANEGSIRYKFIEGYGGVWNTIRDFSNEPTCTWIPKNAGENMIMVQAKYDNSPKPYDFKEIVSISIKEDPKLITDVQFEKNKMYIGEKEKITVVGVEELLLYRFWIRDEADWEPLRDYSTENTFEFTANEVGNKEILIECKKVDSENSFDDSTTIKIEVKDISEIEITDFKMLSSKSIVNEELVFSVSANYESNRPLLYKFLKVAKDGKTSCVQDFSSKNIVAFKEEQAGDYKLLCLVRDMLSGKEYDDRAQISYKIKPYDKVKIKKFIPDVESPQAVGSDINLETMAVGGRELLYRYIIEGPLAEDSGYIRSSTYSWKPEEAGDYNVTLKVKDISYGGDYEDINKWSYQVNEKGDRPVRIDSVLCSKGKKSLINEPINIKVKCIGGSKVYYSFIIYKDGKKVDEIIDKECNWINYVPAEIGEYEIEARVKDIFSIKEFDSTQSVFIDVVDYIPAEIDYLLSDSKEVYLVNEPIEVEAIMENTSQCQARFVTKINGQEVEDTGYVDEKVIRIKPRYAGKYSLDVYAKNKKSKNQYDCKKEFSVYVHDTVPVNTTKVSISSDDIIIGKDITFEVTSQGGKDVCYEFYIMKNKDWVLVQKYSKKDYYTFIPFVSGKYKLLVLSKSYYKKVNYEDFEIFDFEVK